MIATKTAIQLFWTRDILKHSDNCRVMLAG